MTAMPWYVALYLAIFTVITGVAFVAGWRDGKTHRRQLALDALDNFGWIALATAYWRDEVRALLDREVPPGVTVDVVEGGATRRESVAAAFGAAPLSYEIILVHDAARAFVPPDLVERVAAAVREGRAAVVPVLAVVDTIKRIDESGHVVATPERSELRAAQTPQGFRREILEAAYRAAGDDATDDAGLAEQIGVRVFCIPGADRALKITRAADLAVAEALLRDDVANLG